MPERVYIGSKLPLPLSASGAANAYLLLYGAVALALSAEADKVPFLIGGFHAISSSPFHTSVESGAIERLLFACSQALFYVC